MSKPPPTSPFDLIPESERRCGFIAVIGAPNAGKSTFVNAIVGTKVTIVSHKVQTTRMPIRGIAMVDAAQLIFIDTPGIFKPRRRLDRAMVKSAWSGANDADVIVVMIDAQKKIDDATREMLQRLETTSARRVLAINKIDRVKKEQLLVLTQGLNDLARFERTFLISSLKGHGVKDIKQFLATLVPSGPWHYPPDDVTDLPMRMLAAEITREKLFNRLHQELPYAATVETTKWTDLGPKGIRIEQIILVERDSQRVIVLGEGGRAVKHISMEARRELSDILERDVHLFIHVSVKEGWENDPDRYREMGLEFPSE